MDLGASDRPEETPRVRRDAVLRARIVDIKHSGAVVLLPNGEQAWLPAREVVAEIRPHQDLAKVLLHHKNDELDVVVYDEAQHGVRRKLVSHIRVDKDPWDEVAEWPDGAVKVIEVALVTATRALGGITPGIQGQVLLDTLRHLFPPHWRDFAVVRPGDKVAGFVKREGIDRQRRIVTLDVAGFIHSNVRAETALSRGLLSGVRESVGEGAMSPDAQPRPSIVSPITRLMIVDDDVAFLETVGGYLEDYGCEAIGVPSPDKALVELNGQTEPVDLMLVDLHFEGHDPFEGLRLAARVQAERPEVRIILVTGDDRIFADPAILANLRDSDLRVCEVILKPFAGDELLRAMAASNSPPRRLADVLYGTRSPDRPRVKAIRPWSKMLAEVLDALEHDVGAEAVVLFSIHPVSMSVSIVSRAGAGRVAQSVRPNIERSPVRDVAIEEEEVLTGDAADSRHFPKHRWLQLAYRYHSCIGVPVHVTSEYACALFAFDTRRDRFPKSLFPRMRRAAGEIASILYAQRAEARLFSIEPYELLGRAYGSMSHDLRHLLSNEMTTQHLIKVLDGKTELRREDLAFVRTKLALLDERLRQAAAIVHTFGQVARGAEEEEEEVELLPLVASYVSEFSRQHSILRREVGRAHGFPLDCRVRVRPMGLRQVLFNLVLNAVQQIELFAVRESARGEVIVELAHEQRDNGPWACIRVHDTGPGIHGADFDRVFELGYTTKEGGFGMGLDICRRVISRVQADERCGEVRVKHSILFAGTTFEVCLPIPKTRESEW